METGIRHAGQGRTLWVVGDRYTIKTSGAESGGAFALIEALVPPNSGPPPHIHRREDEAFYVLEGELTFTADGQTFTAGPGAWITLARGSLHNFRNTSASPAKMLIVVSPAGLDEFFLEVGREATEGEDVVVPTPEDFARLLELAPKYGLEIQPPPH